MISSKVIDKPNQPPRSCPKRFFWTTSEAAKPNPRKTGVKTQSNLVPYKPFGDKMHGRQRDEVEEAPNEDFVRIENLSR